MQIHFLGGASSIGASCLAVQIGEQWVVVDAGIRMDTNADRLPDLAFLQGKEVVALFVTHAHADHIGAVPLLHQAFPAAPIYTSRSTMQLMDVMLHDALNVMERRATEQMEVPLYGEELVTATMHAIYPLPLTGTLTVPQLPGVTFTTSRAGHVAGAICLGIDAPDGRLLISGDISLATHLTIRGAEQPALLHPDLLILESTYGARHHPDRRSEEERLAQAVAAGIERGGHVLIPAFALGRAQEVLLILRMAQLRRMIPSFPIYVDGLVRTVCTTYTAIPEALNPRMQRQIRTGYQPFFTGNVRPVTTSRQREQIVQSNQPACIISSSGMLTGGPSAFYAAHLAEEERASILITGYQDEESPGRALLSLANAAPGTRTLNLGEHTVTVRCHFGSYSLSAHADVNELAAFVEMIKPRQVALVHGDPESRTALAQRLHRLADIVRPDEGSMLDCTPPTPRAEASPPPDATPVGAGMGDGRALAPDDLPTLWQAVTDGTMAQIVSIRELALVWYGGTVGAEEEEHVRQTMSQNQRYFVPDALLSTMVRVLSPEEIAAAEGGGALSAEFALRAGALLLVHLAQRDRMYPALCIDRRTDAVYVHLPSGAGERKRYPRGIVRDVIGLWPRYPLPDDADPQQEMAHLSHAAQRWQRLNPITAIVEQMQPARSYRLDEVAALLELAPDNLEGRTGLALHLNMHPEIITRHDSDTLLDPHSTYHLREDYRTALEAGAANVALRYDQAWILSVIEQELGNVRGLYHRSADPQTGNVTLYFHFPDVARVEHAEQIEAAARSAGVDITIAPRPHQGELKWAAVSRLPDTVHVTKVSVIHDSKVVRVRCRGPLSAEQVAEIEQHFLEQTGWLLDVLQESQVGEQQKVERIAPPANGLPLPPPAAEMTPVGASQNGRLDHSTASGVARTLFSDEPGLYRVSADQQQGILTLRFAFPDVACQQYASRFRQLAEQTGWQVVTYPEPNQEALKAAAVALLPDGATLVKQPSVYSEERRVLVRYKGAVEEEALRQARATFTERTGWRLELRAA